MTTPINWENMSEIIDNAACETSEIRAHTSKLIAGSVPESTFKICKNLAVPPISMNSLDSSP